MGGGNDLATVAQRPFSRAGAQCCWTFPKGETASGVLGAAVCLCVFFAFTLVLAALDLFEFKVGPVAALFSGLIVFNLGLWVAVPSPVWGGIAAWLYEGFHALILTILLHYFGGVQNGFFLLMYGYLVIHTEMFRPDASVFVTANVCVLLYSTLAWLEIAGWVSPEPTFWFAPTVRWYAVLVSFAFISLNFLAAYANRYRRRLTRLTQELHERVAERTAALVKVNQELTAKAQALEAKQEEFREFVYTVSHELKSPLSSILLTADLILDRAGGTLSEEVREDLRRIVRLAGGSEDMIRDLLQVIKITSAPEPVQWVDLEALFTRSLETLQPQIAAKRITVEIGKLPRVWGQPGKLAHVVSNLLSNAVRYTGASQGRIEAGGWVENGDAFFYVRDNGRGIPESYQGAVFDLFRRIPEHDATVSSESGSGFGLAIVKRIVQAHHGKVWVESKVGVGTRLCVRLPTAAGYHKGAGGNGQH